MKAPLDPRALRRRALAFDCAVMLALAAAMWLAEAWGMNAPLWPWR